MRASCFIRPCSNSGSPRANIAPTPRDGLRLKGAIILNAVKCLPPQNKTLPAEEANCRPFLMEAIAQLPRLTTFIALGKVAHDSLCRSFELPLARAKFAHGAEHALPGGQAPDR